MHTFSFALPCPTHPRVPADEQVTISFVLDFSAYRVQKTKTQIAKTWLFLRPKPRQECTVKSVQPRPKSCEFGVRNPKILGFQRLQPSIFQAVPCVEPTMQVSQDTRLGGVDCSTYYPGCTVLYGTVRYAVCCNLNRNSRAEANNPPQEYPRCRGMGCFVPTLGTFLDGLLVQLGGWSGLCIVVLWEGWCGVWWESAGVR